MKPMGERRAAPSGRSATSTASRPARRALPNPVIQARRISRGAKARQTLEHEFSGLLIEALAPAMLGPHLLVQAERNGARRIGVGGVDFGHVHADQDGLGDGACVVRGRDADDQAGVNGHFGEFVGESAGGVDLQQAVQRTERVVGVFGACLVDFVDHHHRVGAGAVHQGLEDLARACALPLRRRATRHPAGRQPVVAGRTLITGSGDAMTRDGRLRWVQPLWISVGLGLFVELLVALMVARGKTRRA